MTGRSIPEVLDGYQVYGELGEGYTGQVFLGHDPLLDRHVAIKFLRRDKNSPYQDQQFVKEARAIARVQHRNIAAIYRAGRLDEMRYLVLEYISGGPLSAIKAPLALEQALSLSLGVVRGLVACHRRGVVHGDVKPSNILLTRHGVPKLIDFGLSVYRGSCFSTMTHSLKVGSLCIPPRTSRRFPPVLAEGLGDSSKDMTSEIDVTADIDATGTERGPRLIEGTPDYMAPEIWKGFSATPQSDCYAVGAVLYKLIEGCVPFEDVMANDLATAVQCIDAPRATKAPPEVADVIARSLARQPEERWSSAEALYVALEQASAVEMLLKKSMH
ncbi:MAG: serine/threonine protein kinase [Myxococcales bacterium]|nr:serine/threonine protein kinase [Myxococcales bacterium]